MIIVFGIMGYGWYKLVPGMRERQECQREKAWARIHLTPLLQAEEDRDQVRRHYADLAREKALLGHESSAYNSERYVLFLSFGFFCVDLDLDWCWMRDKEGEKIAVLAFDSQPGGDWYSLRREQNHHSSRR
jgi:GRIM-19 protein